MRVIHHRRQGGGDPACVDLDTLFRESDVVSLHCPLRPQTAKLVYAHHLSLLKQARLVQDVRRGQNIIYSLDTTVFQEALRFLLGMTERKKKNHGRA